MLCKNWFVYCTVLVFSPGREAPSTKLPRPSSGLPRKPYLQVQNGSLGKPAEGTMQNGSLGKAAEALDKPAEGAILYDILHLTRPIGRVPWPFGRGSLTVKHNEAPSAKRPRASAVWPSEIPESSSGVSLSQMVDALCSLACYII